MKQYKLAIVGGGAAGYFLAANLGRELGMQSILFEQSSAPLSKVLRSGGGRCNLTHACFDPKELIEFYPRGKEELLSVFHKFQPSDTINWFEERGVPLKTEKDNRVFPVSDNSSDIAECLMKEAEKNQVNIHLGEGIISIEKSENIFLIHTKKEKYAVEKLFLATGSNSKIWKIVERMGHKIIQPVPSLFTFNCNDLKIKDLQGLSFPNAELRIPQFNLKSEGALLVTHWGFSGPVVLKLSSFGAREMHNLNYNFDLNINFLGRDYDSVLEELIDIKNKEGKKNIFSFNPFEVSKRFWQRILSSCELSEKVKFAEIKNETLKRISKELTSSNYKIKGKGAFKEEFVTSGGVDLKEINFKTMESKLIPNLYFAGEILNIDALTGGFNFQACWSESYIVSDETKHGVFSTLSRTD